MAKNELSTFDRHDARLLGSVESVSAESRSRERGEELVHLSRLACGGDEERFLYVAFQSSDSAGEGLLDRGRSGGGGRGRVASHELFFGENGRDLKHRKWVSSGRGGQPLGHIERHVEAGLAREQLGRGSGVESSQLEPVQARC